MTEIPNTVYFFIQITEIPFKKLANTEYRHIVRPPPFKLNLPELLIVHLALNREYSRKYDGLVYIQTLLLEK